MKIVMYPTLLQWALSDAHAVGVDEVDPGLLHEGEQALSKALGTTAPSSPQATPSQPAADATRRCKTSDTNLAPSKKEKVFKKNQPDLNDTKP